MANVITKKGIVKDGQVIIPCEFDDIEAATVDGKESEQIYITQNNDLLGLARINENGEELFCTENEYSYIGKFENGVSIVAIYCERFGTKYGLIDMELNEILECVYDKIYCSIDNLYVVQKDGLHGLYDISNKAFITNTSFSKIDVATIRKNGKMIKEITLELE